MESTIWFTDGFVIITGEIGAGKTTLIETFLHELEKDVVVAQISQTQVTATEFLQSVLVQFGVNPFKMGKAELLATLNGYLVEQYSAGRKVLMIVDEAQNLGLDTLEEIRNALRRRDHQGKGAAHHPCRPAGAERQARFTRTGAAGAARAPALPPDRAESRRPACLRAASPGGGRFQRTADLRGGLLPDALPLHRRRATPHQHAVRHGDDGGLHRRARPRGAGGHPDRDQRAALV